MKSQGYIKRIATGWSIHPATWREPKAAPSPGARLSAGRVVRVTFSFIVQEDATRQAIDDLVRDSLNGEFELAGDPLLEDLGIRTDKLELTETALAQYRK